MRALLDMHAFLWWLTGSRRLSDKARYAIADEANEVLISAASAWQISTKHLLGKLPDADLIAAGVAGAVTNQDFGALAMTMEDVARAGALPARTATPSTEYSSHRHFRATWYSSQ